MKRRSRAVVAILAVVILANAAPLQANAPDPYLGSWKWPNSYVGTYYYASSFSPTWMRAEADAGINVISNSKYRNPDFNRSTSTSSNGKMQMLNSSVYDCAGGFYWVGCAWYSASTTYKWILTLATNVCWTNDGAYSTCTTNPYDVWTITLNEMGHVNTLDHHTNPDYSDAAVQAIPRYKPQSYWKFRYLGSADNQALYNRYGLDSCSTPPCPNSADQ